jgi:HPr kinase/phosphorylase
MSVHGALVEVHGVGVLLEGPSGVGKSECALELISRGHVLVADDVVEIWIDDGGRLRGAAPERVRHYMEIRGLGLIHIPDLFGPDRVVDVTTIALVCRLEAWREGADFERIGIERETASMLGVSLPLVRLPARPGGSMATVVDVAAREHRIRSEGRNAARRLDDRLREEMLRP